MVYFLFHLIIFGINIDQSLLLRSMIMLPIFINLLKIKIEKDAISKFRSKKKEHTLYMLIKHHKDLFSKNYKIAIIIQQLLLNLALLMETTFKDYKEFNQILE